MARNFRIRVTRSADQSLGLKLFGDFDGSSACELLNVLNQGVKTNSKVAIDTDGLRTINAFGLDVVLPRIARLNRGRADIVVTGRFSGIFTEEEH